MTNGLDQDSEIVALDTWLQWDERTRAHYLYAELRAVKDTLRCMPGLRRDMDRAKWILGGLGVIGLLLFQHVLPDLLELLRRGVVAP